MRCKWLPELRHYQPNSPIILVGTKSDMRSDPAVLEHLRDRGAEPISTAEGLELAKQVGASGYVEASALTQKGLKSVFDEAIRAVISPPLPAGKPRGARWRNGKAVQACSIM